MNKKFAINSLYTLPHIKPALAGYRQTKERIHKKEYQGQTAKHMGTNASSKPRPEPNTSSNRDLFITCLVTCNFISYLNSCLR